MHGSFPWILLLGCALLSGCSGGGDELPETTGPGTAGDEGGAGRDSGPIFPGPNVPPLGGAPGPGPLALCGNAAVDFGEECDDGSRAMGDGCTAECEAEPGYVCSADGCVFPRSQIDGAQELRNVSEDTVSQLCSYITARLLDPRFEREFGAGASAPFDVRETACEIADPAAWLGCSTPLSAVEDCIVELGTSDPESNGYAIGAALIERCSSNRLCACTPGAQACYGATAGFGSLFGPAPQGRYFGRCGDDGFFVPEQSVDCDAELSACADESGCVHNVIFGEGIEWRAITGAGGGYDLYYMTEDQILSSFTIGVRAAASQVAVSVVVWEAADEAGPFMEIFRTSQTLSGEQISATPNARLSQGKYYAVGVQWGASVSLSYAASGFVRHAFPFGYFLRSLEGADPASATPFPERRLRASFTMHDVVEDPFTCSAIRGRCATSELTDALELRTLSATQWQAFCEQLPSVPADSVGRLCDEGLFAALGDNAVARCYAYQDLDWSTCALTVGAAVQCWTGAADICTDYAQCMPAACPAAPRLQ